MKQLQDGEMVSDILYIFPYLEQMSYMFEKDDYLV